MQHFKDIDNKIEEHGIRHVLCSIQVEWAATLGVSKKGFWIRTILVLIMSPIFLMLGYGEFANKFIKIGSVNYEDPLSNLIATMIVYLHWMGWLFPYLITIFIFTVIFTKMWSNNFWKEVELLKSRRT